MVSWGLDLKFLVKINVGVRARITVWVKFKVGVRARIAFLLFVRWRAKNLCLFQMIGFYGLLAGNKACTEVLPLPNTRARPIYWSADMHQPNSGPSRYIISDFYRR